MMVSSVTPALSIQMAESITAYEITKPLPKPILHKGRKQSSSFIVDVCKEHLNPVRHISSQSTAMDNRWRAANKQEATLGLLIGVRFALKSKNISTDKAQVRKAMWVQGANSSTNSDVQAIAAYRQCKNQQALNALAE